MVQKGYHLIKHCTLLFVRLTMVRMMIPWASIFMLVKRTDYTLIPRVYLPHESFVFIVHSHVCSHRRLYIARSEPIAGREFQPFDVFMLPSPLTKPMLSVLPSPNSAFHVPVRNEVFDAICLQVWDYSNWDY